MGLAWSRPPPMGRSCCYHSVTYVTLAGVVAARVLLWHVAAHMRCGVLRGMKQAHLYPFSQVLRHCGGHNGLPLLTSPPPCAPPSSI